MKALVRYSVEKGKLRIQDVPKPILTDNKHAIIKVSTASICGRDIEHFNTHLNQDKVPYILGHEFSGEIHELPDNHSSDFNISDRVVCETVLSVCEVCPACLNGFYNLCKLRKNIGGTMNGAFSNYVKVPIKYIHSIPDNISYDEAALIEPMCVCYNALIVNSDIQENEKVVIIGAGTIALFCLMLAKYKRANVIMIAHKKDILGKKLAKKFGAIHVFDSDDNVVNKVLNLTNGFGVPLVIDAVGGVEETFSNSLECVSPGGQITKIGWFINNPVKTNLDLIIRKNIRLQGSFSHNNKIWEQCIRLIAKGHLKLDNIVSKQLPLDQWQIAFDELVSRNSIKIQLKPLEDNNG